MTRELCRRVTAGTVSYRAQPPASQDPDPCLGEPVAAGGSAGPWAG